MEHCSCLTGISELSRIVQFANLVHLSQAVPAIIFLNVFYKLLFLW